MADRSDEYPCRTQDGRMPAFDVRIVPKGTTKSNGKTSSLVIGSVDYDKLIAPRWDIRTAAGATLRYFVRRETFQAETDDELDVAGRAQFAADAMEQAAKQWSSIGFGLPIVATTDKAAANFYLVYLDPNDPKFTAYASAFFPHQPGRDVIVYRKALRPDKRNQLAGILVHELGHALGLRHEFAITGDEKRKPEQEAAVQFMETNPRSVMSYSQPPTMQQSDQDGIKGFYALANGFQVAEDVPVKDFPPWRRADYPDADEVVQWMVDKMGSLQGGTVAKPDPPIVNPPITDPTPTPTPVPQPAGNDPLPRPQGTDPKPNNPVPIPTPAKPTVPVTSSTDKGTVPKPIPGAAVPAARPAGTGTATTVGGKVVVPVAAPMSVPKPSGTAVAVGTVHPTGPVTTSNPASTGTAPKPVAPAPVTNAPAKGSTGHG